MAQVFRTLAAATAIAAVPVAAVVAADQHHLDFNNLATQVTPRVESALAQAHDRVQERLQEHLNNSQLGNGQSGANGNSGGSSQGGTSDGTNNGGGWWGRPDAQSSDTSGTPVSGQPGVVMVDTQEPNGAAAGSGIVWKSDGTIITNYHVVQGSTGITVTTSDGQKRTAKMVGFDAAHDVAVIKIDASGLQTAKFDSNVSLGQAVTAIGQGGGKNTLYKASGTVTDLNQQITAQDEGGGSSEKLTGLIETNAPIVPGYSGGPLFDSDGEVVGINTAASSSTPIQGYAITTKNLIPLASDIYSGTKTATNHIGARGALGLEISATSASDTPYGSTGQFNGGTSNEVSGVIIMGTLANSPAGAAGMSQGDVITNVNGTQLNSADDLTSELNKYSPGQRVSVTWTDTDGASHTSSVALTTAATN